MSVRLRAFNNAAIGDGHYQGFEVFLNAKDIMGNVVGGFRGEVYFNWLFLNVLFVDEAFRGKGLGSQLLRTGESLAKSKGASRVRLETFEWQAPQFYPKFGYRMQTEFPKYFQEKTLYLMVKDL
jgi:GNAT superfamily N-acetyltransferase